MTEQSPRTAEIQKYYKLLTTLIITGFYLASCTTDQDSLDAVLTNNSPTSEVFDTADIVPTDSPPAVEVTNDDFSQANTQETVEATGTQVAEQEEAVAEQVETDLSSGNYNQAVISTEQALANGEFDSLKEALLELWLPMLHEQTLYSDAVFERLSPSFVGLEVNMQGQVVITDADGNVLVENTVPGTSNLEWAIPISKLAYGLDAEEAIEVERKFEVAFENGAAFDANTGLYAAWFVIDDVIQLEEPFELPDGKIITTLAYIYHYDGDGVLQMSLVPYFTYDPIEFTVHVLKSGGIKYDSKAELEQWIEAFKKGVKINGGLMTISGWPLVDYGSILLMQFGIPTQPLDVDDGSYIFFKSTVPLLHNQEQFENFALEGDPNHLAQILEGPFWIPINDGADDNILSRMQGYLGISHFRA